MKDIVLKKFKWLKVLLFIAAEARTGEKTTRRRSPSRSKTDQLRNTGRGRPFLLLDLIHNTKTISNTTFIT